MVQKCPLFVNVYTIENVNLGGLVVKKSQKLVNLVCEQPIFNTGQYLSIPTYLFCLGVPCVFLPKNNHNLPTPDFLYSRSSILVLGFG